VHFDRLRTIEAGRLDASPLMAFALELSMEFSWVPLSGMVVGLALMASTMRRRDGYRGLHELASGTHVIRLPYGRSGSKLNCRPVEPALTPDESLPGRLGPFTVRGVLASAAAGKLLLGEDPSLKRRVWLWVRPEDTPDLTPARRRLGRVTRLRWLAGGKTDGLEWDAFLAPAGCPLAEVVDRRHRLAWADARGLLEQLADELTAAVAEGTLPEALTPEQVWVQANGRLQLLDFPTGGKPAGAEDPDRRALRLLGEVAVLTLEGQARPAGGPAAVQAPLPEYAAHFLARLRGARGGYRSVADFRADLELAHDNPAEVTRPRRAVHLGLLSALIAPGFVALLAVSLLAPLVNWVLLVEGELRLAIARDVLNDVARGRQAATALTPSAKVRAGQLVDHAVDAALAERLQRQQDLVRQHRESLLASASTPVRRLLELAQAEDRAARYDLLRRDLFRFPGEYRSVIAAELSTPLEIRQGSPWKRLPRLLWPALLVWPVCWVVWAFVARGGLSYPLAGITLVGGTGAKAWRLQTAWRALLVWGPVTALLALAMALDARRAPPAVLVDEPVPSPVLAYLAWGSWWAAVLLPAVFAWLALRNPPQAPHDRLAGTYLVPK
jgi:eukaryotic-like serine/threonine-protein kinase